MIQWCRIWKYCEKVTFRLLPWLAWRAWKYLEGFGICFFVRVLTDWKRASRLDRHHTNALQGNQRYTDLLWSRIPTTTSTRITTSMSPRSGVSRQINTWSRIPAVTQQQCAFTQIWNTFSHFLFTLFNLKTAIIQSKGITLAIWRYWSNPRYCWTPIAPLALWNAGRPHSHSDLVVPLKLLGVFPYRIFCCVEIVGLLILDTKVTQSL